MKDNHEIHKNKASWILMILQYIWGKIFFILDSLQVQGCFFSPLIFNFVHEHKLKFDIMCFNLKRSGFFSKILGLLRRTKFRRRKSL